MALIVSLSHLLPLLYRFCAFVLGFFCIAPHIVIALLIITTEFLSHSRALKGDSENKTTLILSNYLVFCLYHFLYHLLLVKIRILLFRENDKKGRRLLFDSDAVQRSSFPDQIDATNGKELYYYVTTIHTICMNDLGLFSLEKSLSEVNGRIKLH